MFRNCCFLLSAFLLTILPVRAEDWQTVLSQAQSDLRDSKLEEAEAGFKRAETLLEAVKISPLLDEATRTAELKKLGFSLVDCLVGISKVRDRRGEYADSEAVYEMGLETLKKFCVNGWKNQDYADYLTGIAELYDRHGQTEKADGAFKQLLEIRTTVAPKDDRKIISAYESYSKYLRAHSRSDEAVHLENKVSQMKYNLQ